MTEKAKEKILPHVRELIKNITHLEPGDEKFSHFEHYIFSNIWNNKFVAVDRYSVRKSIDGIIKKFIIHGRSDEAKKLKELLEKFLSSKDFENNLQYDIQWYLLSLLLHLSYNPTSVACTSPVTIPPVLTKKTEYFNWPAHLLEGQPEFTDLNGGSETEDECYSSDELQEEYSFHCETTSYQDKDLTHKQPVDSSHVNVAEDAATKGVLWGYIEERANAAEKWLKENVQNPSVEGYKARSKFAAANLAEFWDAQQKGKTDNILPTQLMSEYRVLREMLWALQVPPSYSSYAEKDWKGLFLLDGKGGYRVRPSVTIPSLTKESFQSHLRWISHHVFLIRELESFITDIFSSKEAVVGSVKEGDANLPPHTYEAYASALKDFVSFFKEHVLSIEKKIKSQEESTCTLLSVCRQLEPMLKELRIVHGIHQKAICSWEQNDNWYCACRLIAVLYGALLSSLTDMSASICFRIFLKTFQPYLDIIHVWLTEGRLEDWRGEFIITKNEELNGNCEDFWNEGFIVHLYEHALLEEDGKNFGSDFPLGLLSIIEEVVIVLGKNMELLQRLNRLSEFQKKAPLIEGTLYGELKHTLECKIKIYSEKENTEEVTTSSRKEVCECKSTFLDTLSKTAAEEIQNSEFYYLKMAFEDLFSLNDHHLPDKIQNHPETKNKIFIVPVVLPIKPMIEQQLRNLLLERHSISSTIVRSVLLNEFSLTSHLLIIRRIFLMEAGDLVHNFCTHLFQQAEIGERWEDSLSLTNFLQECVSSRYPDLSSGFSISVASPMDPIVPANTNNSNSTASASGDTWLDQVDRLHLNYSVGWPINIILNRASMENYNTIFQFLLKVRWALWSLQQLRFSELADLQVMKAPENMDDDTMTMHAKIHRLQLLRAWLLHFVGSVHAYLMGRVLHGLGMQLEADIETARDLDDLIHVHKKYLETIYCQCLQPKAADIFKAAILRVLDISMNLSKIWKQPYQLTSAKLVDMENHYIRCHVFLANVLSNAVLQGYVRHMETLRTALVHSFPSH